MFCTKREEKKIYQVHEFRKDKGIGKLLFVCSTPQAVIDVLTDDGRSTADFTDERGEGSIEEMMKNFYDGLVIRKRVKLGALAELLPEAKVEDLFFIVFDGRMFI